jgi:hypothetical protein
MFPNLGKKAVAIRKFTLDHGAMGSGRNKADRSDIGQPKIDGRKEIR